MKLGKCSVLLLSIFLSNKINNRKKKQMTKGHIEKKQLYINYN